MSMVAAAARCLAIAVYVPFAAAIRNSQDSQHAVDVEDSDVQQAADVEDVHNPDRDWYSHNLPNFEYHHAPAIRYLDAEDIDKAQMMEGIACFCKKVDFVTDCHSIKNPEDVEVNDGKEDPSHFRWYHADQDLCCKMAFTFSMTWVGWGYKRQTTVDLCVSEVRPHASDECCHLKDRSGEIGLHVHQTKTFLYLEAYKSYETPWSGIVRTFYKSKPQFELEEVTGSADHTGKAVEADTARAFLQNIQGTGRWTNGFECDSTVSGSSCLLRQASATQCCCHQASIAPARRCLPVDGAPDQVQPVWVEGVMVEVPKHDLKQGSISFDEGPEARETIPEFVTSADPEAADDPMTTANESSMVYPWGRINQWNLTCEEEKPVPWVRSQSHSSRYQCGSTQMSPTAPSTPKYCTRHWTTYHQEYKSQCVSRKYTRLCPPGYGLYDKQFPQGACVHEPQAAPTVDELQLVDIGNLSFMCPEEYRSGTSGSLHFDPLCECAAC